jgi:hypothetical protein
LPVDVGVVDEWREEVDGLDDGQVLGQLVNTRVIMGVGADEEIGIVAFEQIAQNLRNAPGGQFARSTGARGVVDQAFFAAKEQHDTSFRGGAGRHAFFLSRAPTASSTHFSSGNSLVLSLE